jgi:teichoic acid transport system ATP-binding protein
MAGTDLMAVKNSTAKQENRKPVVIVDDVHVIYKVYASGKRVTRGQGKNGIFSLKLQTYAKCMR